MQKGIFYIVGILCCIGSLLVVILVPISFQYVEKNTWAFKKNSVTNDVDTSTVYANGRFFWGVGHTSVTFPSTFQHIEFAGNSGLSVFTDSGLELLLDVSFQYRLHKDKLADIFSDFGRSYATQIENIARAALRNEAPRLSIDQYISDRTNVVNRLHTGLQSALDDIWVEVPRVKFQLRRVVLPAQVRDKFLNTFVQNEINKEKEQKAKADLIRKETEKMEREIRGNVTIIAKRAAATSTRLIQDEKANAAKRLEIAKAEGVRIILDKLGITHPKTKSAFLKYMAILDGRSPKFLAGVNGALLSFAA